MEQMVGMIADNPIYTNDHLPEEQDDLYEDSKQEDVGQGDVHGYTQSQ